MNPLLEKLLGEASRLTRGGNLADATAAIQKALGASGAPAGLRAASGNVAVLDGLVREVRPELKRPVSPSDAGSAAAAPSPAARQPAQGVGTFEKHAYASAAGSRHYKLYVPGSLAEQPAALVVMLHGCQQDPDDFAAGTRMNALAEERGFFVLYPAQAPRSNSSKCWNWFVPSDQRRGAGEPELIAGMTREVLATHRIDPARVYAAGLSAGGAMAAILGREYPDLYAAVGVHSGLPQGAAHDVASAFSAMHQGPGAAGSASSNPMGLFGSAAPAAPAARTDAETGAPVIVFHGDHDSTVHPTNGAQVVEVALGAATAAGDGIVSSLENATVGGRSITRTVHRRPGAPTRAPSLAEHWVVHGAGHAWSGGDPRGSFTDAHGPDASREMVRFFEAHPLTKD